MSLNPYAGGPDKSATGGPANVPGSGNNPFGLPSEKVGPVANLVEAIKTTPQGQSMVVTEDVKNAGQSLGDIHGSSGEGGS
ncbi:hypothetical protein [Streptomyces sp. NPDC020607]|uniref:hypothetical protein n=1 Tax=Streptomyces sp. NPDC020607 TaxID=3365082 RepID=UPI0037993AC0